MLIRGARANNLRASTSHPARRRLRDHGPERLGQVDPRRARSSTGPSRARSATCASTRPGPHDGDRRASAGSDARGARRPVAARPHGARQRGDVHQGVGPHPRALRGGAGRRSRRGLTPAHFSFNVPGRALRGVRGRGLRDRRDAVPRRRALLCPVCQGKRFKPEVLAVTHHGQSVADLPTCRRGDDVDEATPRRFDPPDAGARTTCSAARSSRSLRVGLGYLPLGQPLSTLSGGEAQRLKLARALSERRREALFVLDEPSAGLHAEDARHVVDALHALVDDGASVVVVEHDLDVIRAVRLGHRPRPGRRAARRPSSPKGRRRRSRRATRERAQALRDARTARKPRRPASARRGGRRVARRSASYARARAQPEGGLAPNPARAALRRHRPERLGQVVARVRRRLRRRAAALHGDADAVRAPVPAHAAAPRRRRGDRRPAVDRARAADVARRRELAPSPR